MELEFKLEKFEGPLDLLLHLIDKNKVDIYDIPIADITDQYMEYVRQMEEEDMDVMSEFLVMAATLLDIKCRMLLPKEVSLYRSFWNTRCISICHRSFVKCRTARGRRFTGRRIFRRRFAAMCRR